MVTYGDLAIDFRHSAATSIFLTQNDSNFKMLLLIEFASKKNSNEQVLQQISALIKLVR